jgi:aryl-alcohol dehydrogenase-like predicted oxidoreductase/predicted kinase
MRLSTDQERDEGRALETIAAAAEAGITVFDTAHSYGRDATELGHNERLLVRALRLCGAEASARIVTKGGMARASGRWIPDGRAKVIRADCEASLADLDGLAIDLYLVHAPDPATPWKTSLRALARLADERLVRRVGVANVNRGQLDEALDLAPIAGVQVALSVFDDGALRGGVVERCVERGVALIAHSPLGGRRRAGRLARHEALAEVARTRGVAPAEVALAWLLALSPVVVPIPGARRPETARSAARAATLVLDADERALLERALGTPGVKHGRRSRTAEEADVVVVMGIPGAGKSRVAEAFAARGYLRLNRDERGGTLRELAAALDESLASGVTQVVLDNTYLTRAARSHVLEATGRHGVAARCVWLDTPLAQAQVNLVERLLERFDALPTPDELKEIAKSEPGLLAPTSQMRALRELEPPTPDEGWAGVEQVPFARTPPPPGGRMRAGVFVGGAALERPGWEDAVRQGDPQAPHLVFDWRLSGDADALVDEVARLGAVVSGPVEGAVCPHSGGPPVCWCRPPLPGLPLAFARAHDVDPARSTLLGVSAAHKTLATTLGARYVAL